MFYKNALKMGTSEGTVQCTYATIYADNRGTRPLFSFQRKDWAAAPGFGFGGRGMIDDLDTKNYGNMSYGFASGGAYLVDEGIVATYTGYGREGVIGWDDGKALRGESTVYTTFDFPLVVANEWSADRYVPVRLVQEAAAYLRHTLDHAKAGTYTMVYKDESRTEVVPLMKTPQGESWKYKDLGGWTLADDLAIKYGRAKDYAYQPYSVQALSKKMGQQSPIFTQKQLDEFKDKEYVVVEWNDISPKYRELRDKILNSQSVYYVKPAAFRWHPIDIKGYQAPDLEPLRKEYEQARNMLILAGGAALL